MVYPVIYKTYHEMAEHYGMAVFPARVRRRKTRRMWRERVGVIYLDTGGLRNQKFFSLPDLNRAIRDKLDTFNSKPFQKKTGSRLASFLEKKSTLYSLCGLAL
jgi:hypothetical protein